VALDAVEEEGWRWAENISNAQGRLTNALDSYAQNVEQDHYNKLFCRYESNGQPANRSKQNFKYIWLGLFA
jgi:hypothetical protein